MRKMANDGLRPISFELKKLWTRKAQDPREVIPCALRKKQAKGIVPSWTNVWRQGEDAMNYNDAENQNLPLKM